MNRRWLFRLNVLLLFWHFVLASNSFCQQNYEHLSLSSVNFLLNDHAAEDRNFDVSPPWWRKQIGESIEPSASRFEAGVNDLLCLAVANSAKVSIARHVPLIRKTAVTEAAAAFDWTKYAESSWNDISEPIGSSLTVGGDGNRFRDEKWDLSVGARRRLFGGGSVDFSQELGHQDNNSTFFVPNDQATSRIVLGYTQPLLRGRGNYYNSSLILLAKIDVGSADSEFRRQLQAHLLEVARAYWSLYLERARLAQQIKLYHQTKRINDLIATRQLIDAHRTQLISAQAALESRKSDLIRAVAGVKNAETRIRALINSDDLASENPDLLEIIPIDHPSVDCIPTDLGVEFVTAAENRPELKQAMKSIRAACIRLKMARHEILPRLDLVTQTYISGLRGNSEFGNAWLDQFREGEPSYSVGLQYEIPVGGRAGFAAKKRRQLELSQMREEYRNAMELIRSEVEVAVREVQTAYRELMAKDRARKAAENESVALETRWRELPDDVAAGLTLESLLRSQERVNQTEFEFATAQLTYNLALVNLRHANGTLINIIDGVQPQQFVVSKAEVQPQVGKQVETEFAPPVPSTSEFSINSQSSKTQPNTSSSRISFAKPVFRPLVTQPIEPQQLTDSQPIQSLPINSADNDPVVIRSLPTTPQINQSLDWESKSSHNFKQPGVLYLDTDESDE